MPDTLSDSGIKFWVIEVSYGYGCIDYYGAFASEDPVENDLLPDDFFNEAGNNLWDQYSWTVLGWNDEDVEGETDDIISEKELEAYNKKEKTKKIWKMTKEYD